MGTSIERAKKVLASQGKSPGMLTRMTAEEVVLVAVMCDEDGNLIPDVRTQFSEWLANRCNGCGQNKMEE